MVLDVRVAELSDLEALLKLAKKLIPGEIKPDQRENILKSCLHDPKHDIFVAEDEDAVIGFVDLWMFPDFVEGGRVALIGNLIVDEEFRGRGVGSLLLEKALSRAEERGALEIHVWTEFDNKSAIGLYKKHGLTKEHLLLEKEL